MDIQTIAYVASIVLHTLALLAGVVAGNLDANRFFAKSYIALALAALLTIVATVLTAAICGSA